MSWALGCAGGLARISSQPDFVCHRLGYDLRPWLLKPHVSHRLLNDINAPAIARYVGVRRKEGAADESIKLELGTLRGILKREKLWGAIADDDLLPRLQDRDDVGRAITTDEEAALLAASHASRSRGLYTAVVIALNTGMRETETSPHGSERS